MALGVMFPPFKKQMGAYLVHHTKPSHPSVAAHAVQHSSTLRVNSCVPRPDTVLPSSVLASGAAYPKVMHAPGGDGGGGCGTAVCK